MPTYVFECPGCAHELEVKTSEPPHPPLCPNGCPDRLKRMFGLAGVSFKGNGFYKTDARTGER